MGASLELISPATTSAEEVDKYYSWRSSSDFGGSPGTLGNGPIGVIVNEVLAHTDPPVSSYDAIELYNPTSGPIDISGWFLSDSSNDLLKYEIPAGTMLPADEYVVFDEQDFNPTPLSPGPKDFALSGAEGDDVWLVIPDELGGVATFVDDVHFRATFNGATLGVTENSSGRFVPLTRNTLGCGNSQPLVDDVYIGTINYLPGPPTAAALAIEPGLDSNDLEYLVVSGQGQLLDGWRIRGGIDFDFPEFSSTVPTTWIVSFDPENPANASKLEAFREHYGLSEFAFVIGGYSGSLSNSGEQIRLERPDTPPLDDPAVTPYVTVDEVIYDDQSPWPMPVAGDPIVRRASMFFGNDGNLWTYNSTFDVRDNVRGDFNGDKVVDAADIDLLFDAVNRNSQNSDFVLSGTFPIPTEFEIGFYIRDELGIEFGDANLDGAVDAIDFGIWNSHKFQSCTGWASGDFNGDGQTDGSDFNIWNDNKFFAAELARAARPMEIPRQPLPVSRAVFNLPAFRNPVIEPRVADSHRPMVGRDEWTRNYQDATFGFVDQGAKLQSVDQTAIPLVWAKSTEQDTHTHRSRQTPVDRTEIVQRTEIVDHIFTELGSTVHVRWP